MGVEMVYDVTVKDNHDGGRRYGLRKVSHDEAETYAEKVNKGEVDGESDALVAQAGARARKTKRPSPLARARDLLRVRL